MRKIRHRVALLSLVGCLCILLSILILFSKANLNVEWMTMSIPFLFIGVLLAVISIFEIRNFITARLIIENQIMHIESAEISHTSLVKTLGEVEQSKVIEVFVSCFGILLDAKVVKFNQAGIHLKNVVIASDFICLTYGTQKKVHKTRIIHERMERDELDLVAEKFRYETGVLPEILDQ